MILGMTGFGAVEIAVKKIKIMVEIRTVNHRFLDISYYLPTGFVAVEDKIRQIVQKYIERGRVTVLIKIIHKSIQTIVLNKEIVKKHIHYANALHQEFGLTNDLSLADIIQLPGVLETKEVFVTAEEMWPVLERAIHHSLKSVVAMRRREGRSLVADVADNLKLMSTQVSVIRSRAAAILTDKKKIFSDEEFKSFQKGADIHEEMSRLSHFINELKALLRGAAGISAGKKIDFIAQEMQRETNTIGSKFQDKIVSNLVVNLKSTIENIREQAQNIE